MGYNRAASKGVSTMMGKGKNNSGYVQDISSVETEFSVLEAYRSIRTNIIFSLVDAEGCKKVVVTSAMASDGKTTTCINIAMSFAQLGMKVLIIDADLRRPMVHRYLGLRNDAGLSDVLAGLEMLDNVIKNKSDIDFISAGRLAQNPAELLASKRMEETVEQLSQIYDYIFIDTPPASLVTDAVIAARLTDGVVLVTRHNYTDHRVVDTTIKTFNFAGEKILGFVLNGVKKKKFKSRNDKHGYYKYIKHDYDMNRAFEESTEKQD